MAPLKISLSEYSPQLAALRKNFSSYLRDDFLYFCGDRQSLDLSRPSLAVVGTRNPTAYGLRFVREFMAAIATFGWNLISGGALGIDGEAHRCALRHRMPTQAWLVGPIQQPNPRSHWPLFQEMTKRPGCGVFVPACLEPAPGKHPLRAHWIERNQWLVAAADVLVVVEARLPSGTWSSVAAAEKFGVTTHILPGAIDCVQSQGTNQMIALGKGHPITNIGALVSQIHNELQGHPLEKIGPAPASNSSIVAPKKLHKFQQLLDSAGINPESFRLSDLICENPWTETEVAEILAQLNELLERNEVRQSGNQFEWIGKL